MSSFTPGRFIPREELSQLVEGWVGHRADLDAVAKKYNLRFSEDISATKSSRLKQVAYVARME
jgi:hypothetical protein